MDNTRTLDPKKLTEEFDAYELTTYEGLHALDAHIRECWSVRQIVMVCSFLHGGRFTSDAGWTVDRSGYVARTWAEDRELAQVFERLRDTCENLIGAACALNMQDAKMLGGYVFADEGDGPTVYDLTINELVGRLPEGLRERLERATKPIEAARDNARGRQGGLHRQIKELEAELAEARRERDAARLAYLEATGCRD